MVDLVPIDHDPFDVIHFVPVDHDPFDESSADWCAAYRLAPTDHDPFTQ